MTLWHQDFVKQLPMLPLQQLEDHFGLSQFNEWPNANGLNLLKTQTMDSSPVVPEFVCQSMLEPTDQYYEQIIYEQHIIPTRPNGWHDLFNALIWMQFPKIKSLLNQLHVADIKQFGLSPRTIRRNNLTHFDECGVLLTYESSSEAAVVIEMLKQHQWDSAFVKHRKVWGTVLNTFMFGHANLEMLLQPFIGLTGKWLAIEVDKGFQQLSYQRQLLEVDTKLAFSIKNENIFMEKKPLHPLPLLGIPGVWEANFEPSFYQNTDYFRPKRKPKILK